MFADHPLLGVGLGCSVIAWPLYAPSDLYSRGALVTHNTVIQPLGETGILGFIPFMLFVGFGIYYARRLALDASRRSLANLGAGLEIAVWGFVVCGLSGGYVLTWFPYILLGMVSSARRIQEESLMAAAATHLTSPRAPATESVFRPALLLMSGRTVAFAATFFIPLVLARIFDPAQFGTYKQLFLIWGTVYSIAQLGMASSLYYFLPRAPRMAGPYVANCPAIPRGDRPRLLRRSGHCGAETESLAEQQPDCPDTCLGSACISA